MSDSIQIHVAQMNSTDDVAANVRQALELMSQIPELKPEAGLCETQLICFPENSLFMRLKEGSPLHGFDLHEEFWMSFAQVAKERNAYLHIGSIAFAAPTGPMATPDKYTNSSVTITPQGKVSATYSKIHLFDIDLEGHRPVRETDAFEHGADVQVLEVGDWRFGQSICYDIRFSELYARYAKMQVDAILVPSAFLVPTGIAHWELLLRARAVESQAYLLAAAQAGRHENANGDHRATYGHSMVVDPWGRVLQEAGPEGTGILSARLERAEIGKVRRQMPMRNHRRLP